MLVILYDCMELEQNFIYMPAGIFLGILKMQDYLENKTTIES